MRVFALLLLPAPVLSCIKYSAVYPFSETAPFQATITDDNLTTCWISRTYREHNRYQQMANLAPPTRAELQDPDMTTWGFKRWDFECLPEQGYEAWANVGVRTVVYRRKREEGEKEGRWLGFVSDVREDVWGEKWIYGKSVECDGKEEAKKRKDEEAKKKEDARGEGVRRHKKLKEQKKGEDERSKLEQRKKEEEAKKRRRG
ncbi:hypothetical protein LOCC1_G000962 [Lachnellula occidentalis]|uniref:Uncharacterized protein n=1 Tax=Lachnellula occidentalis TaxID=215460 RepID=A0A8H8S947_9HELO|nr:hypothetical protein LOCC1_G000962 [Lachnellula occidentalis]